MCLTPPQRTCSHGFTLIELMVVLVLIGIVSAVMIPEMTGTYQDALLRSAGRKLISAVNVASSRAVSSSQMNRFQLDAKTGRYIIGSKSGQTSQESDSSSLRETEEIEGSIDPRISVRIQRAVPTNPEEATETEASDKEALPDPSDVEDAIRFFPDGTADARMILLEDRAGFRLAFRINPVTSRVHIMEVEPQ